MQSQPVEYLAVSEALLNDPTTGEPVVVITIRPDPPNWFSVNLALSTAQAGRLLADLQNLLIPFVLLVAALLAATVGCSEKVEVESATWNSPASEPTTTTGEKAKTAIQLDLLQSRPSEPATSATSTILNVSGGDIHIGEAPEPADKPALPRNFLNTKIGFPSTYWQHGPLAFRGFSAVCLLVGAAVVLMMVTVGRRTGGPMLSIIILLVAAGIILQALPAAKSGLQFIPLLPWHCSGPLPILVSILCWASLLVAVLIAGALFGLGLVRDGDEPARVVWRWLGRNGSRFDDFGLIEVD
jgi:hypothetical protein